MTAYHSNNPFFYYPGGAGFTVLVYQVDTVIPIATYKDKDKLVSNVWPVVLNDAGNGDGVAAIYIDATYATLDLRNLDDVSVAGYPANWGKPAQQDEVDAIDDWLALNEATDVAQTEAIGILQEDVIALDDRLDAAEATIIAHAGQIGALQSADIALDVRLDSAEATIIAHTGQIGALQSADIALDVRLDALETIDHAPPTGSASAFYDPTTHTLIQSGVADTASDGMATITFGTAYTSNPNVIPTSFWSGAYQHATGIDIESITTTNAVVRAGYITNGSTVWEPAAITFCWLAIGEKT